MTEFSCLMDAVQSAIKLTVLLLFLGSGFIWIMMPTNIYRQKWLPKITTQTSSTYFGAQGVMLLLFTFPILFISALGCIYLFTAYLYLAKRANDSNMGSSNGKKKQGPPLWKKPMLVRGPLGIVSGTELAFLIMFIALLVWSFSTYLPNIKITPKLAVEDHEKLFHMKLGLNLYEAHMLKWDKIGISNVAGELSLLSGLLLWVATIPGIRRKLFELFFYTHHLYILFVVLFIFRVGISYACIMLPGFYLFMVDYLSKLEPEKLSVVIKSEGSWSQKLYQMLSSTSSVDRLNVSVEGPYGPASTNYLRPDLPTSGIPSDISNLQLQIEAYITRDREPKSDSSNIQARSIWFKPYATDSPISAIGSKQLALAWCSVLWNKKHNAMEAKQIQNMASTPATSPASMIYNEDRELESLRQQSLVHVTNVHYGGRPNLKKMLSELEGASVGVMASGPKKMRQEVAAICSSGLHFESISFSW
ncbi:hypothetical protein L6164_021148 [Bauhinia variegata]|uniref:Uncharacterized protein n=1 Tax=Bauhinia variegata TaxID=167791 RepID=A0ACB9MXJ4_BAUVA|nr:hypothetical protein L6164_021148 [Bauhinia variegata]